jgi:hypothetical protein
VVRIGRIVARLFAVRIFGRLGKVLLKFESPDAREIVMWLITDHFRRSQHPVIVSLALQVFGSVAVLYNRWIEPRPETIPRVDSIGFCRPMLTITSSRIYRNTRVRFDSARGPESTRVLPYLSETPQLVLPGSILAAHRRIDRAHCKGVGKVHERLPE